MDADDVAIVEATVVSGAALVLLVGAVVRVLRPRVFASAAASMQGNGLWVGGLVAVLATVGSLWFSHRADFPPCVLCWYQRIAMYPLALLLPLAALRRDRSIRPYVMLLAGVGLAVNTWHNVVETFPNVGAGGCDPANPCTIRWVEAFGFWTIPRMATVCFLAVLAAVWLDRPTLEENP